MTAKEARKKASSISLDVNANQIRDIREVIEKAVKKGKLSTYYYESVKPPVLKILGEEGYTVSEYSDFREGITVTISW